MNAPDRLVFPLNPSSPLDSNCMKAMSECHGPDTLQVIPGGDIGDYTQLEGGVKDTASNG